MSVLQQARRRRSGRLALWIAVGATGAVIDLSITVALLGNIHYLAANAVGFAVAVSSNFCLNYMLTYGRPGGQTVHQYLSYVGLSFTTFTVRALAIATGVEVVGLGVLPASMLGIGLAASLNFIGCERILGDPSTILNAAVATLHDAAEFVFSTRLRSLLLATGAYGILFRLYARALSLIHSDSTQEVAVNGATAELHTTDGTEIVSVLHTLQAEGDVLDQWVDDIQPGDEVLDGGANLGIFSVLAADRGAAVRAVEPHEPTATRCERNFELNDVDGGLSTVALGRARTTAALDTEIDQPGTQRAALVPGGSVQVVAGDELDVEPDVIKLDVEGHEQAALDGLEQSLAAARLVFVEAHGDDDERELRDMLRAAGFAVEQLSGGSEVHLRGVKR
jgi:FkbM family methyltransferase